MPRFSNEMVAEAIQPFWAALQRGEFIADAAVEAGTYRKQGARWVAACGGLRPRRGRNLKGRCLSFHEREEIAVGRAAGDSIRVIARRLGRSPSTVSRELRRNADRCGAYRASAAHARAYDRPLGTQESGKHVAEVREALVPSARWERHVAARPAPDLYDRAAPATRLHLRRSAKRIVGARAPALRLRTA
jgi:hypothetical protein